MVILETNKNLTRKTFGQKKNNYNTSDKNDKSNKKLATWITMFQTAKAKWTTKLKWHMT